MMLLESTPRSLYFKIQKLKEEIKGIDVEDFTDESLFYVQLILEECGDIGFLRGELNSKIAELRREEEF